MLLFVAQHLFTRWGWGRVFSVICIKLLSQASTGSWLCGLLDPYPSQAVLLSPATVLASSPGLKPCIWSSPLAAVGFLQCPGGMVFAIFLPADLGFGSSGGCEERSRPSIMLPATGLHHKGCFLGLCEHWVRPMVKRLQLSIGSFFIWSPQYFWFSWLFTSCFCQLVKRFWLNSSQWWLACVCPYMQWSHPIYHCRCLPFLRFSG